MGKIRKVEAAAEFNELEATRKSFGENNDCSVKAVSLLTGVSYAEAHAVLKRLGRKDGQGCLDYAIRRATREITGVNNQLVDHMKIVAQYPGVHNTLKNMTTYHPVRFKKVFENVKGKYLVFVSGHVCAMIDGKIIDWSNDKALRVESMWKVGE